MNTSDPLAQVRQLTRSQTVEAATTLATAFIEDPLYVYFLPDDVSRPLLLPLLMRAQIEILSADGHTYYISQPSHGVALLQPPERRTVSRARIAAAILKYGIRFRLTSLRRVLQVLSELEQHRLPGDHYYLMTLGVRPSVQRKGLGSLFLDFAARLANERTLPLQLETANPKNIKFYSIAGYRTCATFRCDKGRGPEIYIMRRGPKPT